MKNLYLLLLFTLGFNSTFYAQEYMYWADYHSGQIFKSKLAGDSSQLLLSENMINPASIAIDPNNATIYWTDRGTKTIESYDLQNEIRSVLVNTGLVEPRGIALDLTNQKMYWVDLGISKIQRANLDGSNVEDIITSGILEPHDIKLDVENGKVYWTDRMAHKVQRANLDGTSIETLVNTGNSNTSCILLDLENDIMYWGDTYNGVLSKSTLDGGNIQIILNQLGSGSPFRVEFNSEGNRLFYSNVSLGLIFSCNLDGSDVQLELQSTSDQPSPTGIVFYTPITTSTEDLALEKLINILPNPATDEVQIKLTDNYYTNQIEKIQLFSSDGKIIKQLNSIATDITTINISKLPVGSYFLAITFLDQKILTKKLVKMNRP